MNKAFFILPFILLSLVAAIWSGLIRMGWSMPITTIAAQHGTLMVNSFLASLIFLERAVVFKIKWVMVIPFVNAMSIVALAFDHQAEAHIMCVVGSIGFLLICAAFIYQHKEIYYYIFFTGALCLFLGNIILLRTNSYPDVVNWWIGFLLFTIVAERLELSKYLPLSSAKKLYLIACLVLVLFSLVLSFHTIGKFLLSFSLAIIALWLLKYDMAKRSIKIKGQHRYSGILLIVGFVWLLIAAALLLLSDSMAFGYDAVLHSFFIGFVFSMIFSHAPIILPAVTRLPVKIYRSVLYIPFFIMQFSLIARVVADIIENMWWRKISGMINGLSILFFFITVIVIMIQELKNTKTAKV